MCNINLRVYRYMDVYPDVLLSPCEKHVFMMVHAVTMNPGELAGFDAYSFSIVHRSYVVKRKQCLHGGTVMGVL